MQKNVAIACQGGGIHAAFTCGVLTKILETQQEWGRTKRPDRFNIIGISGTSAGALCALMVWYGLAPKGGAKGSTGAAIERLNFLWDTFAASNLTEVQHNALSVLLFRLKERGVPLPEYNPYAFSGLVADTALLILGLLGARDDYLDFDHLLKDCCPEFDHIDWPNVKVRCLAGAIEVRSGNHEVFDTNINLGGASRIQSGWRQRRPFSLDGIKASGTLPQILQAQRIGNLRFPYEKDPKGAMVSRDGVYWDGLYSQNPPVREFLTEPGKSNKKPNEIWVIRINPQERLHEPEVTEDIRDRENELAGSVSLNQELDFILTVNRWADRYAADRFGQEHQPVTVRTLKMRAQTAHELHTSSKFNRFPSYINALRREGSEVAQKWLENWPNAVGEFPDDASYS